MMRNHLLPISHNAAVLFPIALIMGITMTMPTAVRAHGMRTGFLEITEQPTQGDVTARLTLTTPAPGVSPYFPQACSVLNAHHPSSPREAGNTTQLLHVHCTQPLAGLTIGLNGLGLGIDGRGITEAAVVINFANNQHISHVLTVSSPTWQIPHVHSGWHTGWQYVRLGTAHVLQGADHLLFLVLLVLLLGTVKRVLLAETAFTVSHSISFGATAMDVVHVSPHAAEVCIALSLLLLALEVPWDAPQQIPSWTQTIALPLVFGLVHGLGFAGGLREIGIPEQWVGSALIGFGAGVECGQLLFLLLLLGVARIVTRTPWQRCMTIGTTYAVGALATYWFIDRLILCFFPSSTLV